MSLLIDDGIASKALWIFSRDKDRTRPLGLTQPSGHFGTIRANTKDEGSFRCIYTKERCAIGVQKILPDLGRLVVAILSDDVVLQSNYPFWRSRRYPISQVAGVLQASKAFLGQVFSYYRLGLQVYEMEVICRDIIGIR